MAVVLPNSRYDYYYNYNNHYGISNSNLLQRRLETAYTSNTDTIDFAAPYQVFFKPENATTGALPFACDNEARPMTYNAPSVAPKELYSAQSLSADSSMTFDNSFADAFAFDAPLGVASWGSLAQALPDPAFDPSSGAMPWAIDDAQSSIGLESCIKSEAFSPGSSNDTSPRQIHSCGSPASISSSIDSTPTAFTTEIDTLMRAIQTKTTTTNTPTTTPQRASPSCLSHPGPTRSKQRHHCPHPTCTKTFHQRTHLSIHLRSHTGEKPFPCRHPTCNARFTQIGNLKTHERRHTGERPYVCATCGKRFAQHGNERAHQTVHSAVKPYSCELDSCGKGFSQLGNLKAHQNRFHTGTLRGLTERFEGLREGDVVCQREKELYEYFAGLYRNCNKGIKGRGKDRRVGREDAGNAGGA